MMSREHHAVCILMSNLKKASLTLVVAFTLTAFATQTAQSQALNVLHTFTGGEDGANPFAGLTMDRAGNLYGTTSAGGAGYGTVFQLKRLGSSWILAQLYSFEGGNDGNGPRSRVVFGPDGTLYGTSFNGGGQACGGQGCGTVFKLSPSPAVCTAAECPWNETVLYRFTGGSDGGEPIGNLIFDQAGNIYGTTVIGGLPHGCGNLGCGTVYKLTLADGSWSETVIHEFGQNGDGTFPDGGVVFDQTGNLYGTTFAGGSSNLGTAFQLTYSGSSWEENILYAFEGLRDGDYPVAGVIFDASGNLYGTTTLGGTGLGGTIFKLTPSQGGWTFSALYELGGIAGPFGNLSIDSIGNLFGTTFQDGSYSLGSAFKLTPSDGGWTYNSLHDFTGNNDGELPQSSVVFDANGDFYGTAAYGGANGYGVVVEITP